MLFSIICTCLGFIATNTSQWADVDVIDSFICINGRGTEIDTVAEAQDRARHSMGLYYSVVRW